MEDVRVDAYASSDIKGASVVERVVEQAQAAPGQEVVVSRHRSLGSARARVPQMRSSEKGGSAPLSLRAAEVDDGAGGVVAVVLAKFSPTGPDRRDRRSQVPRLRTAIDCAEMSYEEFEALIETLAGAWESKGKWEIPERLLVQYLESQESD